MLASAQAVGFAPTSGSNRNRAEIPRASVPDLPARNRQHSQIARVTSSESDTQSARLQQSALNGEVVFGREVLDPTTRANRPG